MSRNKRLIPKFSTALSILITASLGYAQSEPGSSGASADSAVIDEVVVVGEATLDDLRLKLYSAETNVYDLFNDLNDQSEFDVICVKKAPVGTHIKQRYCEPKYVQQLSNEALRERRSNQVSKSQLRKKQEEFQSIMEELANENDELLLRLVEYSQAADRYDAAIDAR